MNLIDQEMIIVNVNWTTKETSDLYRCSSMQGDNMQFHCIYAVVNNDDYKMSWSRIPHWKAYFTFRDFSRLFWGRISAPFPMEKRHVFSQKVDKISQSEAPTIFSNLSSLIHKYLGHSKMGISGL